MFLNSIPSHPSRCARKGGAPVRLWLVWEKQILRYAQNDIGGACALVVAASVWATLAGSGMVAGEGFQAAESIGLSAVDSD